MKIGLYSRLAWNNIKKNAKLYIPNILSGIGLTAVFYIILTLSKDERLTAKLVPLRTKGRKILSFTEKVSKRLNS